MKNLRLDLLSFLLFILFLSIVLFDFIRYDHIITYKDNTIPPLDYMMYFYIWDEDLMGHNLLYRLPHFVFSLLSNVFGILIVQKIFMASIFFLPFTTFYLLMRNTYKIHPASAFISALIYAINPVTINFFWGDTSYVAGIFYSIIPLVLYAECAYLNEKKSCYLIILLISISLLFSLIPHISILVLFFIFAYSLITMKKFTEPRNLGILLVILLLGILLSINTLGFLESRITTMENPSYDQRIKDDIEFAYSDMQPLNIISLTGNNANYFIYSIININNLSSYKWLFLGMFVFTVASLLFKEHEYLHSLYLAACLLMALIIVLILMYVHSIPVQDLNDLGFLGIIRNPDKLYFIYLCFFSMAFAFSVEKFLKNLDVTLFNILPVILFFIVMAAVFFPVLGTFCGLDKFYSSNSIEKLSMNESYRSLPGIIKELNLSGRIAVLPYEITLRPKDPAEDVQNILIPVLPQIAGIRKGGILEYNSETIDVIKRFYVSISSGDNSAMDDYSRILGVEAYMIRKNVKNSMSRTYVETHWQGAPYIAGDSELFIDFFKRNNYGTIFENDDFIIFKSGYSPYGSVYGVRSADNSSPEINPKYLVANHEKATYTKVNPIYYEVYDVNSDMLILSQSYNSNWIACGVSECVKSQNVLGLNGFKMNNTGKAIEIKYERGTLYFLGTLISYSTYLILILYILYRGFNNVRQKS